MTDLSQKPIVNRMPGEADSFEAAFGALLGFHAKGHDKMIPARVVNYDRAKNMATVQPMIMFVDVSENGISRPEIQNIPVMSLGGGGFHINFPLKQNDLGWILAADRDISLYIQSLTESAPPTGRHHSFGDAWFVPDVMRKYTISGADSAAMVIQSVDAATRISIAAGVITITAPTSVKIDTPKATFTHDVEIQGNLQVDGNTTLTGTTTANGGFDATGSTAAVSLPAQTKINGITVATHGHISSSPGTRTSGNMIS